MLQQQVWHILLTIYVVHTIHKVEQCKAYCLFWSSSVFMVTYISLLTWKATACYATTKIWQIDMLRVDLACQDELEWVWPFMNRYRMFFVQTSTLPLPLCMHQKLTTHGRFCKQNNQLPTKNSLLCHNKNLVNLYVIPSWRPNSIQSTIYQVEGILLGILFGLLTIWT
jgi:hypothetical protein